MARLYKVSFPRIINIDNVSEFTAMDLVVSQITIVEHMKFYRLKKVITELVGNNTLFYYISEIANKLLTSCELVYPSAPPKLRPT